MGLPRFLSLFSVAAILLLALPGGSPVVAGATSRSLPAPEHYIQSPAPHPEQADTDASVQFVQLGLSGAITSDILVAELTSDDQEDVLLGTSVGLYILSSGTLLQHIPTSSAVLNICLLDDITGDGKPNIALAIGDTYFPNIRCYDGISGDKIWQFSPQQEVFIENLMWTEQQTYTLDIEVVDLNRDNRKDVVATSGYCVYAIDGRNGSQIWRFEASNNLWKITIVPDLNGDGIPELAAGGQNGFLHILSGNDGEPLWQERIAEKYGVADESGDVWATVEQSVWDIAPVDVGRDSKVVVSSEDGKVRLISLRDRSVDWETELIEYVEALQFEYYERKWKKPTSPWDAHFFNLCASLVPDVTGDGIDDILASSYLGQRGGDQEAGKGGIFLLNSASGRILWQNTALDMGNVAHLETFFANGKYVLLLPRGKSGSQEQVEVIDLENGRLLDTVKIASSPESFSGNRYTTSRLDDSSFILVSDYGDLLCVSPNGEVLWHYPRVTEMAVEQGDFTGSESEDLLIYSKTYPGGRRELPSARVLQVVDGATGEEAWTYQMPYEEFVVTGGISGIIVPPDLNGDGKQDIAGFTQPLSDSDGGELRGEGSNIVVLSGKDGETILKQPVVEQTYYGMGEELLRDPSLVQERIEEKLWQQFEVRMKEEFPKEWQRQEKENRQRMEEELERDLEKMREQGAGAVEIALFEQQGRQEIEAELERQKEERERDWREHFEEMELPRQLAEWQKQLKEQEGDRIDKRIVSLDVIQNSVEGSIAFIVATVKDVFIISPQGELLWTRTYEPWMYRDPFTGEQPPGMEFSLTQAHNSCCRVPGDINGDGIDDLVVFSDREIIVGLSELDLDNGELDFHAAYTTKLEHGWNPREGGLVGDIDGDGIKEALYLKHRENQTSLGTIMSPASGETLLEVEYEPQNITLSLACADFDGDGYKDTLKFQRWTEKGPKLEILGGRAGNIIWDLRQYQEERLFQAINYHGSIMPAAPISDISGDGIADLALVKSLTWQPGVQVALYDVARNREIKNIVLERIDPAQHRERRWHPGILVREVEDFNSNGTKELVVVAALGASEEEKEFRLMVVDIHSEEMIADFSIVGGELFDSGTRGKLGVVGLGGEVYFLDVANNLGLISPMEGSSHTSPLKIEWQGVPSGAYNQIFIDGIEVGRINENEFTIPVAQGEHDLTIRSLDEFGRGVYRTARFTVEKESAATGAIIAVVILVLLALWLSLSGVITSRRRRREYHG